MSRTHCLWLNNGPYLTVGKSCSNRSSLPSVQGRACGHGRETTLDMFCFFRCKSKHSLWVVNSYRQNTTTYNTKYLYLFKRKASQSRRGPAQPSAFFFFYSPSFSSERHLLSICLAARIAREGINRILEWVEF